ncbi:PDC sensor domain-containing protein [Sulfurimonas microaerophilic]|uniref:PDC sensor domain-containing protein n=1 Tax=Sulfurimonas microaerophilic TaxID=3058392 RepID=UPI002715490D|nr:PDC sensor domain-containing protein [Sulfurimonas sp. hsl 1-7]
MQEFMETYNANVDDIEKFLTETIYNLGELSKREEKKFENLFKVFPSLELVYICDNDTLVQISDNIYRDKTSSLPKGRDRSYLMKKIRLNNSDISISKPYISSATGKTCITVVKEEADKIYFMDFTLTALLDRLGLIELHREFNFVSKSFYFVTANLMILLAVFTLGYSIYELGHSLFFKDGVSIESIFKPIIALTLGLAIFDLSKTILEQEVVFKSYSKNSKLEYKVFTKFSITIIIALLIESLMVVFKIALHDYSQMLYAVYLIAGVSILVLALGLFIFFTRKVTR